jgi:hypothetical protein
MTVTSSTSATRANMAASSGSDICLGTCPTNSFTLSLPRPSAAAAAAAPAGCCCCWSLSLPSSAIGRALAGWLAGLGFARVGCDGGLVGRLLAEEEAEPGLIQLVNKWRLN